ncbi:DUF1266 domain-containing protein [Paenibacillus sp. M1]|uniref:DUF1266 domain-containing protein n=1 Tax=Paenibacillus haidiansis TaxID=1574488 RepID=A0ABU7VXC8_9BACL
MTSSLTIKQQWILGAAAILLERNGLNFANGYDRPSEQEDPGWKEETMAWLADSWSVTDHDSALYQIRGLIDDGKRTKFDRIRTFLNALPLRQQRSILHSIEDPETAAEYRVVYTYNSRLTPAGIAGYDWGRSLFVAHYAKLLGFISADEAWDSMAEVAALIQRHYDSWEEYGTAFIIGRQFFYKEWSEESAKVYFQHVRSLLIDEYSPWRTLPWDTPLG